jgi:hypothetical protein
VSSADRPSALPPLASLSSLEAVANRLGSDHEAAIKHCGELNAHLPVLATQMAEVLGGEGLLCGVTPSDMVSLYLEAGAGMDTLTHLRMLAKAGVSCSDVAELTVEVREHHSQLHQWPVYTGV